MYIGWLQRCRKSWLCIGWLCEHLHGWLYRYLGSRLHEWLRIDGLRHGLLKGLLIPGLHNRLRILILRLRVLRLRI